MEGQIQGADGTLAKPTGSWANSKTTGWYRIGADNIGFAVATTKLLDLGAALVGVTGALTVSTTTTFTGVTTHGGSVVSDTDSTDDLGTTGVRWANLWVDAIAMGGTLAGAVATFSSTLTVTGDIAALTGIVVGNTVPTAFANTTPELQVVGTGVSDSSFAIGRWGANANAAQIRFYKSRHTTIGSLATVVTGDALGELAAYGDDGVDAATLSSRILFGTEGTIAAGKLPGTIEFQTATTAGNTVAALTLDSSQNAVFGGSVDIAAPNTVAGTGLMVTTNDSSVQEIMRDSSSARYKEDIEDAVVDVRAVLAINSKRYGRKGAVGSYLGFIVEDFHDAGFGDILAYDDRGPAGFLEFGRGVTALHHVVLQSQDARIAVLEAELAELKAA